MKNEKMKYSLICAICLIGLALIVLYSSANKSSDMIMPAVYIVEGMTMWHVMLLGLVAEAVIVKFFLKHSYLKSATITLSMNLVSTLLGFVTTLIAGLIVEVLFIPFSFATYHVSHWIGSLILIVLMNACVEGLFVKIGFKLKFKKTFLWLCLANACSMIICFLFNLAWISAMIF